jgi:hypothetical protein
VIPANIDYLALIGELNDFGIVDSKIEMICGLAQASVRHLKNGRYHDMTYQNAARLYNFWAGERQERGLDVLTRMGPSLFENNQHLAATT